MDNSLSVREWSMRIDGDLNADDLHNMSTWQILSHFTIMKLSIDPRRDDHWISAHMVAMTDEHGAY